MFEDRGGSIERLVGSEVVAWQLTGRGSLGLGWGRSWGACVRAKRGPGACGFYVYLASLLSMHVFYCYYAVLLYCIGRLFCYYLGDAPFRDVHLLLFGGIGDWGMGSRGLIGV